MHKREAKIEEKKENKSYCFDLDIILILRKKYFLPKCRNTMEAKQGKEDNRGVTGGGGGKRRVALGAKDERGCGNGSWGGGVTGYTRRKS